VELFSVMIERFPKELTKESETKLFLYFNNLYPGQILDGKLY
jgi:hypothetical protein